MKIHPSNLAQFKFKHLTFAGYSIAGEETVVVAPELQCVFDIGRCPQEALPMKHVLLTHGHTDHAAGLLYYFAQRDFQGLKDGIALVPSALVDPFEELFRTWGIIDSHPPPHQLIGMNHDETFTINKKLHIRTFATNHNVPSLGYSIIETCHKLKADFYGINERNLIELKNKGVSITTPEEIPLVAYLGDTAISNFADLPYVANAKILILECTFFEDAHLEPSRAYKHMHVSDLPFLLENMHNEKIVITHTTKRTNLKRAKEVLHEILRPDVAERTCFLMDSQ